MYRLGNH